MKTWMPLLPALLCVLLVVLFAKSDGVPDFTQIPSFQFMPYIFSIVGFVLGCFFLQSRVSFVCLILAITAYLVNDAYFIDNAFARGDTVVFLAAIYFPVLMLLFYQLGERGVFSAHGFTRVVIVASAIIVIALVPHIELISKTLSKMHMTVFSRFDDWGRLPEVGVIVFVISLPVFLIRNKHESPYLGIILAIAVFCVLAGLTGALNARQHAWGVEYGQAVFRSFMSAAGLTFAWAVMEASWRSSHIDELTGLPGRRSLRHQMAKLGEDYIIAMVDIDHFKKINDKYGHETGDQVLKYVASQLNKSRAGKVYRYGGEEFVFVCKGRDMDYTVEALEKVRILIKDRKFIIRSGDRPRRRPKNPRSMSGPKINVAVSIGVAMCKDEHMTPHDVLTRADKALYKAKDEGRNRLCKAR